MEQSGVAAMAGRKIKDIIFAARGHLNDREVPFRYSEEDLYNYMSDAMEEARLLRPDLYTTIGLREDVPQYGPDDGELEFPLSGQYVSVFAYYVAGKAELRDDEFAADGRAALLIKSFIGRLTGSA